MCESVITLPFLHPFFFFFTDNYFAFCVIFVCWFCPKSMFLFFICYCWSTDTSEHGQACFDTSRGLHKTSAAAVSDDIFFSFVSMPAHL